MPSKNDRELLARLRQRYPDASEAENETRLHNIKVAPASASIYFGEDARMVNCVVRLDDWRKKKRREP